MNILRQRPKRLLLLFLPFVVLAPPGAIAQSASTQQASPAHLCDGAHDFDFEIGTWKAHLRRLLHPLTGSTTWVEYDGTTVVRKVWDGRANLVELVADGPAGHFEGLSFRLYNPDSHQWSLNFANSRGGTLGVPTIGEFKNGRGEFYDQETLNGRAVLVRFIISDTAADSCHFEQAFSDDGGRTWEVNWIADDTRVKAGALGLPRGSSSIQPGHCSPIPVVPEVYAREDRVPDRGVRIELEHRYRGFRRGARILPRAARLP